MTNEMQAPLGSGFDAASSTFDVLDGVDLTGTAAVVTGGYSGLGLETTRALAAAGAEVIVGARRPDAAREAVRGMERVEVLELDLADLASVRRFAEHVSDRRRRIGLVVCSAGVMACPERRVHGWELQLAVNHLGHFALVNQLTLDPAGARVVAVSSGAHRISGIRWHDMHFTAEPYDGWQAYGQSKTANALFASWLAELGRDRGIRAYSVHPGSILTPLQRHIPLDEQREMGWLDEEGNAGPGFKTAEQGAATIVWAAISPLLDARSGVYCEDCDVAPVVGLGSAGGVAPWAIDPAEAERLWSHSATAAGVSAFA